MAKKRRSTKKSKGRKSSKKKSRHTGGNIPLPILEKRLKSLGAVVSKRGSDLYVASD
jgi:hypothetical protein